MGRTATPAPKERSKASVCPLSYFSEPRALRQTAPIRNLPLSVAKRTPMSPVTPRPELAGSACE